MVAEEAIKVKREVVAEQVMVRVGLDTVGELEVMVVVVAGMEGEAMVVARV